MASALFSEDLTCSLCLTLFSDPVTLPCGHSFCRRCVTEALNTKQQCPLCQAVVSTEATNLPGSHILRSLAEKAKEAERTRKEHEAELCPEHEEKLKLFCVTDQKLACIICRDGESHEGHRFKPVKEAAAALRKELEANVEKISGDIVTTESLINKQREEIRQNKETSQQLMTQIHRQFEEMHQFLEKREKEIKSELRIQEEEGDKTMSQALKAMETALSESRELEAKAASVLKIQEPERFLKSWTEGRTMTPEITELRVLTHPLSLGPYESHLQFFVWKEMLQMIQPRAEQLMLQSNSSDITVSEDGRCLISTNKQESQDVPSFGSPHKLKGMAFDSTSSQRISDFGCVSDLGMDSRGNVNYLFGSSAANVKSPFTLGSAANVGSPFGMGSAANVSSPFGMGSTTNVSSPFGMGSAANVGSAVSVDGFSSGQHYWEVEVGNRDYWELGLENNVLKYEGQGFVVCGMSNVKLNTRIQKVGIYINCSSHEISFYDADTMTLIHTSEYKCTTSTVLPYFMLRTKQPDYNPVAVCWY